MKRYAIAIFHGLGDCVNATTILRPLRAAGPCTIRWITHERYAAVVDNNPLVDEVTAVGGDPLTCAMPPLREGEHLISPAPYNTECPRAMRGLGDSLLARYKGFLVAAGLDPDPFEPLLYLSDAEVAAAEVWLRARDLSPGRFVLMETAYGSQQSFWNNDLTAVAVEKARVAGFSTVIAHAAVVPGAHAAELPYRLIPALYDRAAAFIGVSSGLSCLVHAQSCRKDVPHLELARGDHWDTTLYPKQRKRISYDRAAVPELLDWLLGEARQ